MYEESDNFNTLTEDLFVLFMWEANVIPQSQETTLLGRVVHIVWGINFEHWVCVV